MALETHVLNPLRKLQEWLESKHLEYVSGSIPPHEGFHRSAVCPVDAPKQSAVVKAPRSVPSVPASEEVLELHVPKLPKTFEENGLRNLAWWDTINVTAALRWTTWGSVPNFGEQATLDAKSGPQWDPGPR